jgi:hypothetical protein
MWQILFADIHIFFSSHLSTHHNGSSSIPTHTLLCCVITSSMLSIATSLRLMIFWQLFCDNIGDNFFVFSSFVTKVLKWERECEKVKKLWVYEREDCPKGCHKMDVKISLLLRYSSLPCQVKRGVISRKIMNSLMFFKCLHHHSWIHLFNFSPLSLSLSQGLKKNYHHVNRENPLSSRQGIFICLWFFIQILLHLSLTVKSTNNGHVCF